MDVGEQRGERAAWRGAFLGADFASLWQDDACSEEPPYELEHSFVPHDAAHLRD